MALDNILHFWSFQKQVRRSIPFCSVDNSRAQRNYGILCARCSWTHPVFNKTCCKMASLHSSRGRTALMHFHILHHCQVCSLKMWWHLIRQNLFFKSLYNLWKLRRGTSGSLQSSPLQAAPAHESTAAWAIPGSAQTASSGGIFYAQKKKFHWSHFPCSPPTTVVLFPSSNGGHPIAGCNPRAQDAKSTSL